MISIDFPLIFMIFTYENITILLLECKQPETKGAYRFVYMFVLVEPDTAWVYTIPMVRGRVGEGDRYDRTNLPFRPCYV